MKRQRPLARLDTVRSQLSTRARQHWIDCEQLKYRVDGVQGVVDGSVCGLLIEQCARLKAIAQGRRIHEIIRGNAILVDDSLAVKLLAMYCKCGSVEEARAVFDGIRDKNVVCWTSLIGLAAKSGRFSEAFEIFRAMQLEGVRPNAVTYVAILGACVQSRQVDLVRDRVADCEVLARDAIVRTAIMNSYGRCGDLDSAWSVFDAILLRDEVVWNAMISLLAAREEEAGALELFHRMKLEGVSPNTGTCVAALNACCHSRDLSQCRRLHAFIREKGDDSDAVVRTALINMYGKFGRLDEAEEIFRGFPERDRDVVAWNAMITAQARSCCHDKAFQCFREMLLSGESPSRVTYVATLSACFSTDHLDRGEFVTSLAVGSGYGFESGDAATGTAIMTMFNRCGSPQLALRNSFLDRDKSQQNNMAWNAVLALLVDNEQFETAFQVFRLMLLGGVVLDVASLVTIINACGGSASLRVGKQLHTLFVESELTLETSVQNALVTMYARCGSLEDARETFSGMTARNVVSWTAMVGLYAQVGLNREALHTFKQALLEGIVPNDITFTAALNACGNLASVRAAKTVHACLTEVGSGRDVAVANSFLCALGKCGNLEEMLRFFEVMPVKDQVSWNTIIAANAQHGRGEEGVHLFQEMQLEGFDAGLVAQGYRYFLHMSEDYGFPAQEEHHSCVIDLLSRAGWLEHAEEFVKRLPFEASVHPWITLLCGCKLHGDLDRGGRATQRILKINPGFWGPFLAMHHLYAGAGKWSEAAAVRKVMVDLGPKKEPGLSWIEVKGRIHEFRVGDASHPRSSEIHRELERLSEEMRRAGFVCDTKSVVYDLQAEEREALLCQHSEKLAIAFGLIATADGEKLRIMKNLRVCGDCHSATKFISRVMGREIVVRDAYRFHLFRDGNCSCGDYW